MLAGHVYESLARALEDWRTRSPSVLAEQVGRPPEVTELLLSGEAVRVETAASWADPERRAVLIKAVAYGPASWHTERVSESLRVDLEQRKDPR